MPYYQSQVSPSEEGSTTKLINKESHEGENHAVGWLVNLCSHGPPEQKILYLPVQIKTRQEGSSKGQKLI